jgi:hypothetical protein
MLTTRRLKLILQKQHFEPENKETLAFDSNISGALNKPLNHGSFKKQNFNRLIAKLKLDVFQGIKCVQSLKFCDFKHKKST